MRLPSIDELEIAYKEGITESWKSDWQKTENSGYWTFQHYSEARAYYFLVALGELDYLNKKDIKNVRCKRWKLFVLKKYSPIFLCTFVILLALFLQGSDKGVNEYTFQAIEPVLDKDFHSKVDIIKHKIYIQA